MRTGLTFWALNTARALRRHGPKHTWDDLSDTLHHSALWNSPRQKVFHETNPQPYRQFFLANSRHVSLCIVCEGLIGEARHFKNSGGPFLSFLFFISQIYMFSFQKIKIYMFSYQKIIKEKKILQILATPWTGNINFFMVASDSISSQELAHH